MGAYDDRPYEVGKGKPPQNHKWRKGQSGNPKGPRRKPKLDNLSLQDLLAEFINELVPVTVSGREVLMPKKHAILLSVIHDGLSGTPAQRLKAFNVLKELGAFEMSAHHRQETQKQRDQVIADIVRRLAEEARREGAYDGD
jgi:hypothetical protein